MRLRASRKWNEQRVWHPDRVRNVYGVEVKQCPFCACSEVGLYLGPSPHMTCANCGADGPSFDGSSETLDQRQFEAVMAWNGSMPRQPVWADATSEETQMKRPIEEVCAGDAFRNQMVPKADILDPYPAWRGWVIMDAFLAGIDWARSQHASDCAAHNAPAGQAGECDCK